ncbi:TPA: hypothetical protein ACUAGZ_004856, partial [Escherichia coli]
NKILQEERSMNVIHGIVCTFAEKVEKTLSRLVTSSNVKKHPVTRRFVRVRKADAHASLCHRYTPTKVTHAQLQTPHTHASGQISDGLMPCVQS